jgi:drug/metabolite transporter (DMT)-like permease
MNEMKTFDGESGHRPENLALGGALTAAAFFCVALVATLAKVAGQYTSTGVLLVFQNVICLVFMVPVVVRGGWPLLCTDRFGLHVLRAVAGTACWYALFVAITMIPLANATLLTYSAPLWMPLIAWAVTRRRVARATWIGAAIGFAGIILVLQPQTHRFTGGEFFALVGALALAIAMMTVRWLGATESVTRILVYYFLLSTLLTIPIAAIDWQPIPWKAWGWLIALGLAQFFSQILLVVAYRYASAEKVGPFIYCVIVFTALIDWLVWDHRPTLVMCIGMALVISGGLIAVSARSQAAPELPAD